jgi:hypothetical protein
LTGVESTLMRQGCLKDYFPHTESQLFLASPMLLGRAGVPGREGVTGGLASLVRALLRTPSSRRTNRASSPYKTPARSHNCIQQHTLVYLSLPSTQAIIHDLISSPYITHNFIANWLPWCIACLRNACCKAWPNDFYILFSSG